MVKTVGAFCHHFVSSANYKQHFCLFLPLFNHSGRGSRIPFVFVCVLVFFFEEKTASGIDEELLTVNAAH